MAAWSSGMLINRWVTHHWTSVCLQWSVAEWAALACTMLHTYTLNCDSLWHECLALVELVSDWGLMRPEPCLCFLLYADFCILVSYSIFNVLIFQQDFLTKVRPLPKLGPKQDSQVLSLVSCLRLLPLWLLTTDWSDVDHWETLWHVRGVKSLLF